MPVNNPPEMDRLAAALEEIATQIDHLGNAIHSSAKIIAAALEKRDK